MAYKNQHNHKYYKSNYNNDTKSNSSSYTKSETTNITRQVTKSLGSINVYTVLFVIMFFLIGAIIGIFALKTLTKNDTFEVLGEKEIVLNIGDTYTESGSKAIAFGKDISADVKIIGIVDTNTEGIYSIIYTIDNFKFKDVKRVRTVVVVNPNADENN